MATIGGQTYVTLSQSPAGLLGASNLTNGFPVRCVRDLIGSHSLALMTAVKSFILLRDA